QHTRLCCRLYFQTHYPLDDLHSFPTRRSSDLVYRWVQLQGEGKSEALAQLQRQATPPARKMAPRHLAWLFLRASSQLEKQEKQTDRKSTRLNSSHRTISYAVFCLKKKKQHQSD